MIFFVHKFQKVTHFKVFQNKINYDVYFYNHLNLLGDCSHYYSAGGSGERWIDVVQKKERLIINPLEELKYGAKSHTKRKN